jgi:hypothetical protein
MEVKEVRAGRLYRIRRTEINGVGFAKGGGHLWVAETSGGVTTNVRPMPTISLRSVATGEVLEMPPLILSLLGLEEADGGDT